MHSSDHYSDSADRPDGRHPGFLRHGQAERRELQSGLRLLFYLEKESLYPAENRHRMSNATLENYICNYLASIETTGEVAFS